MTAEPGLRERKKLATRVALSEAAWSLMIDKGLDAVTPEAVAEAVDVSPRTFRNYFASREEAIVECLVRRTRSIAEALRARPAGEPLWNSLMEVLPFIFTEIVGPRDDLLVLMRAVKGNPAMLAQHLVAFEHSHWLTVKAIAERTGADADNDLAPRLLAAATAAVVKTSIDLWADSGARTDLAELIRDGLSQMRAGLPLGTTRVA